MRVDELLNPLPILEKEDSLHSLLQETRKSAHHNVLNQKHSTRTDQMPSPRPDTQKSRFFALPRELRDQIYTEILNQPIEPFERQFRCPAVIVDFDNKPTRPRTPGYLRPYIHCTVSHKGDLKVTDGFEASLSCPIPTSNKLVWYQNTDFQSLLLVSRQVRLEAVDTFKRFGVALEITGDRVWSCDLQGEHASRGMAYPTPMLPKSLRQLFLFLDLEASHADLDTWSEPILKLEIVDNGQRLNISSCVPFADHSRVEEEMRTFVYQTCITPMILLDNPPPLFTGHDLERMAWAIGGPMKVGKLEFRIVPGEGDLKRAMSANRPSCGWLLKGNFNYVIISVGVKEVVSPSRLPSISQMSERPCLRILPPNAAI
jgi:hypothetical protein